MRQLLHVLGKLYRRLGPLAPLLLAEGEVDAQLSQLTLPRQLLVQDVQVRLQTCVHIAQVEHAQFLQRLHLTHDHLELNHAFCLAAQVRTRAFDQLQMEFMKLVLSQDFNHFLAVVKVSQVLVATEGCFKHFKRRRTAAVQVLHLIAEAEGSQILVGFLAQSPLGRSHFDTLW